MRPSRALDIQKGYSVQMKQRIQNLKEDDAFRLRIYRILDGIMSEEYKFTATDRRKSQTQQARFVKNIKEWGQTQLPLFLKDPFEFDVDTLVTTFRETFVYDNTFSLSALLHFIEKTILLSNFVMSQQHESSTLDQRLIHLASPEQQARFFQRKQQPPPNMDGIVDLLRQKYLLHDDKLLSKDYRDTIRAIQKMTSSSLSEQEAFQQFMKRLHQRAPNVLYQQFLTLHQTKTHQFPDETRMILPKKKKSPRQLRQLPSFSILKQGVRSLLS
jgi:hypothetical protein